MPHCGYKRLSVAVLFQFSIKPQLLTGMSVIVKMVI